jgi:hypothetical protein
LRSLWLSRITQGMIAGHIGKTKQEERRASARFYRPRNAEHTVLYQVVAEHLPRRATEAEGIRFLFEDAGAPAGIVRQGARIDLSTLPSDSRA